LGVVQWLEQKSGLTRRVLYTIVAGVLTAGGASGFGGFRMGLARQADPKPLQDLQTKLQQAQTMDQSLNAEIAGFKTAIQQQQVELSQKQIELAQKQSELVRKQTELDGTRSRSAAESNRLRALLQNEEQLRKNAESDAATFRDKLKIELHRVKFGMMEWSGNVNNSQLIEINDGRAHPGSLRGSLPTGVLCNVFSGDPAASIVESPSAANPSHLTFRVDSKGKSKMTVRLFWGVS